MATQITLNPALTRKRAKDTRKPKWRDEQTKLQEATLTSAGRKNADRVKRARAMLETYGATTEGAETALVDLLADLFHLVEKDGISFDHARRIAYMHYSAEVSAS